MTQLNVLGVLQLHHEGKDITPTAPKVRHLLALLALSPNRSVSAELLCEEIWTGRAFAAVSGTLQTHVWGLRRTLKRHGCHSLEITTDSDGYTLHLDPARQDSARFVSLMEAGQRELAVGSAASAYSTLARALELWRGDPFRDVIRSAAVEARATYLLEQRRHAVELKIDAALASGRNRQVIGELMELAAREPAHEWVQGRLMLALARCGRRPEALEAFQQHRRHLREGLGLEPSVEMMDLQRQILRCPGSLPAPVRARPLAAPLAGRAS